MVKEGEINMPIKVCVTGETKKSIFIRAVGQKSNKPVGQSQEIPLSEWDDTQKEFIRDNIWEITLDDKTQKYVEDQEVRMKWLSDPSRIYWVLKTTVGSPSIEHAYNLGVIAQEYYKLFNKGMDSLVNDVNMLRSILIEIGKGD